MFKKGNKIGHRFTKEESLNIQKKALECRLKSVKWKNSQRDITLRKKRSERMKGENNISKRTEVRKKISEAQLGKPKKPHSDLTKKKISEANKGKKWTLEQKIKHKKAHLKTYKRILKEVSTFEKQGYRCIPILDVIPDIILVKGDNLIIKAVEVEYLRYATQPLPKRDKYNEKGADKMYDEVIWIIKNEKQL
jgi:hypothetical protein